MKRPDRNARTISLLGSARFSCPGHDVLAIADFSSVFHTHYPIYLLQKFVSTRRRNQHARRVRYPIS
jgi:hypothetical protein